MLSTHGVAKLIPAVPFPDRHTALHIAEGFGVGEQPKGAIGLSTSAQLASRTQRT